MREQADIWLEVQTLLEKIHRGDPRKLEVIRASLRLHPEAWGFFIKEAKKTLQEMEDTT